MKYKKKQQRLRGRQAWWDKQSDTFKRATTRPGSIKRKHKDYGHTNWY